MTSAAAEAELDLPKLEKYELLGEIGHGGMATVYRGRDRRLGREVAVKIIHRHLRDNAEVATRFLAEARAAASLKHRGIVEVYDVSSVEDREKFLVAELVRGVTLRKLLVDDRDMPAEIGAAIVLEVCDAIQHAHESGIVHRDVKPENVLVELPCHRVSGRAPVSGGSGVSGGTASGRRAADGPRVLAPVGEDDAPVEVGATESDPPSPPTPTSQRRKDRVVIKITDFGIAKVLDAQGVTSTGQVLGSPAHMAPEQIEGGNIDVRTDVFALGVLLYEAVVGHLPFEGKNPAQVLRRVLEGEYSPVDVERSDVGTRWGRVVKAAMALSPEDRTATPAELAEAIRTELRGLGILEPHEEIVDYFDEPEGFRERHRERLVHRLLARGEKARKDHDVTGAAADFNRALALAPQDAEVQRRVLEMSRGRGRAALLRRGGALLGGSLLLGLVAFFVVREVRSPHLPLPAAPALEASADPDGEDPLAVDPDLEEDDGFEDPLPEGSSRPAKQPRKPRIALRFDGAPRVVVFAVNPMGARLTVDGTAYEVTDRPRLVPGSHTAVVSPNDACCEESTVTFVVKPADAGNEADPQTVSISAKFRPATVLLTGAPPGGQLVCGAFGFTLAAGGTMTVPLKRAQDSDVCDAISSEGRTTRKTVTLKAGRSNAIPWPVQGGGG